MANTVIQLKKSSTPSAVPGSLEFGELAINYADGKIYYKNTNSQITVFPSTINYFGTVNANGVLVMADTPGDILTLEAGENIIIVGDAINDKVTISANIAPAFDKANAALANSTGTLAGSLTVTGDFIAQGNVTLGDASSDTITINGSTISLGNNQSIDSGTLFVDAVNNRVGIGITAPTSRLHVNGTANITSTAVFGGNVGIGTTTPTSNLHVIGTANITSNVVVGGSVTAIDFNSVSDMILKENIQPIHNSFDILSQINPVSFKWKDRNETSYGVVAQDIEKVLPEIVNTNESGVKSVAYIQLIAFLIDAVNTLQKEVQELKTTMPSNPQEVENGSKISLHKNTKKSKANRKNI